MRLTTHMSIPMAMLIVLVGAALTVSWLATGAWTASAFARPHTNAVLTGVLSASSSAAGHPAAAVGDGRQLTVWRALDPALPQWVMLDLGSRHQVASSTVSWIAPGQVGFSIYGSTNGVTWSRLANESWNTKRTTHDAIKGAWRYLRLQITYVSAGTPGIAEWRLNGSAKVIDANASAATPAVNRHRGSSSWTSSSGSEAGSEGTLPSTPAVVQTPTPTPTPTVVQTPTPTPTPTVVQTPTPTPTPTVVQTPTPTPTARRRRS